MPEENLDIEIVANADGEHDVRSMKDAFDDLRRSMRELLEQAVLTNSALMLMTPAILANAEATKAAGGVTKEATASWADGIPILEGLVASLSSIGPVGWVVVGVLAALAEAAFAVTSSWLVMAAAAVTVVTATVVGFGAIATAAGLALGPIALLGAGIAVLGLAAAGSHDLAQATTELEAAQDAYNVTLGKTPSHAQQVEKATEALAAAQRQYNEALAFSKSPLGQFEQGLDHVKTALGQQALPLLQQMATWAQQFLPVLQQLGSQMISWFGDRLPTVLRLAGQAVGPIVKGFTDLGNVVGPFIDQVLQRMPTLGPMLQEVFKGGVDGVKGFLDNLIRLVDWFIREWPKIKPVAIEVMDAVGKAIQEIGKVAANLVTWFVANWPEIKHTVEDLKPVWDLLGGAVWLFANIFVGAMKEVEGAIWVLGKVRDLLSGIWSAGMDAQRAILGVAQAIAGIHGGGGGGGGGGTGGDFTFAYGGVVPGPIGAARLAVVHGGEEVLTPEQRAARASASGGATSWTSTIVLVLDGVELARVIDRRIDRRAGRLLTST